MELSNLNYLGIIYTMAAHFWMLGRVYIMWIVIHYAAAHLYTALCAPKGILGFLTSPLLVPAIHCQALLWCLNRGSNTITTMWVIVGTYIASRLLSSNKQTPEVESAGPVTRSQSQERNKKE